MKHLILTFSLVFSFTLFGQSNLTISDLLNKAQCADSECFTNEVSDFDFDLFSKMRTKQGVSYYYTHKSGFTPTTNSQVTTVDTVRFSETSTSIITTFSTGNVLKLIPILPEIDSLGFIKISTVFTNGKDIQLYQSGSFPEVNLYIEMYVTRKDNESWEVIEFKVERFIQ